jgi:PKD repeat protein
VGSDDGKLYAFKDPVTAPTADFTAAPLTGPAPLTVQFTDASASTETLTYAWDFQNDGTVDSTDASPQFTYNDPGTYSVSLMVTNSAGSDTEVKDKYITVEKGTAAPEFPAAVLPAAMIIGLLGAILFIRSTKEH